MEQVKHFMESFKQNLEEKKFSAIEKEREARISEGEREKFSGGYSSNPENIKKFIEIGVEKIVDKLPINLNLLDGGGRRALS